MPYGRAFRRHFIAYPLRQNSCPAMQNWPLNGVLRLRGLFTPSQWLVSGFPIFMELYDASSSQGFRSCG